MPVAVMFLPDKLRSMVMGFAILGIGFLSASADEQALRDHGQRVYAEACASCHGEYGEGVSGEFDDPLVGDETVGQLAARISETMPEGDPESCVGKDAHAVASYIHHAFYSAAARIRNRPPRIELARLTAEQLRQSLADLYEHFFDDGWVDDRRGIEGNYFDGQRWDPKKRRLQRVDATLSFNFGREGPGEGVSAKEYYILWSGSLKANRTGTYEIILRSTCSCMMRLGHPDRELINNHVQSEGRVEFREPLRLVAGRVYPMKIEFTQRKRKTTQPPAEISLSWIPPGGVEQVIPSRHLIPAEFPPTFALQTKLPADDRSYGYERGTDISHRWDESTTTAALEFADATINELWPRYQKRNRSSKQTRREQLRSFLTEFCETALRGPISDERRSGYVDRALQLHEDDAEAIKRCVLITLKSPLFLYPSLDTERSPSRRVANRLALVMYDSLPSDQWLIKSASREQLKTEAQVRAAATRMIRDYRARGKVLALMHEWLDIANAKPPTKSREKFPHFDGEVASDLRDSLETFIDDVVWSEQSDFRELLTADWTYTTDRLENVYGPQWSPKDPLGPSLRRSVSGGDVRHGILTHPLLMSHFAYHETSSPVHRGVFLVRKVLGRTLRPPESAFSPLNPELHPELTTRQRVSLQTDEVNCQVCHEKINSLGFAMEHFDAAGRFRKTENAKPIDARGHYVDRTGRTISFDGTRELSGYLANSRDCQQAFVEAAFRHMVKQPIAAFGTGISDQLTDRFAAGDFSIRDLIVEIAVASALQVLDD